MVQSRVLLVLVLFGVCNPLPPLNDDWLGVDVLDGVPLPVSDDNRPTTCCSASATQLAASLSSSLKCFNASSKCLAAGLTSCNQ